MTQSSTLVRAAGAGKRKNAMPAAAAIAATVLIAGVLALAARPARAVDGCLVLLCFAAPNWHAIPQCVPPIRQVLRDLARGRPFPTCAMAGAGNSANHAWASAPSFCPPQYTRELSGENGPIYSCEYSGAVSVSINGAAFARTWWNFAGDTVTEFSAEAKTQFGNWDTRFDDDYAAWFATQPPPAPVADSI
jgi:hypothetical protein